ASAWATTEKPAMGWVMEHSSEVTAGGLTTTSISRKAASSPAAAAAAAPGIFMPLSSALAVSAVSATGEGLVAASTAVAAAAVAGVVGPILITTKPFCSLLTLPLPLPN
ncbi:unnamed protein product, partial [Ectocarpus sp. 13 AM-2016]